MTVAVGRRITGMTLRVEALGIGSVRVKCMRVTTAWTSWYCAPTRRFDHCIAFGIYNKPPHFFTGAWIDRRTGYTWLRRQLFSSARCIINVAADLPEGLGDFSAGNRHHRSSAQRGFDHAGNHVGRVVRVGNLICPLVHGVQSAIVDDGQGGNASSYLESTNESALLVSFNGDVLPERVRLLDVYYLTTIWIGLDNGIVKYVHKRRPFRSFVCRRIHRRPAPHRRHVIPRTEVVESRLRILLLAAELLLCWRCA